MVEFNPRTFYPLYNVHDAVECANRPCVLHSPSKHALSSLPLDWDRSTRKMNRKCHHNVMHPDPDDTWYAVNVAGKDEADYVAHACDGCCDYVLPPEVWAMVGIVSGEAEAKSVVKTLMLHKSDWLLNARDGTMWVKRGKHLYAMRK